MTPEKTSVPAPVLVMDPVPLCPTAPSVNVTVALPPPFVLLSTLKVALPPSVVAPNVTPAVAEFVLTLAPAPMFRVWLPMESVPSVSVIPAVAAVALSDKIVEALAPVTTMLYALTEVSVARSSVPPFSVIVPVMLPAPLALPSFSVPDVTDVPPA